MPYINSTKFGDITIDDKKYHQVLIIDDEIKERDYEKLKKLFGTSHKIGDWEEKELLADSPEVIVIGTGQDGALVVNNDFSNKVKNKGIEFFIEKTPEAMEFYNNEYASGKAVNALIHTTC